MKYLFLLPFLFIAYCSNAQNSKPYYYFPHDSNRQLVTDTTKGFTTAKWAIIDMHSFTINTGTLVVYFDNGSHVNLLTIFQAEPTLLRNEFIYQMAALEYMNQRGFCLIGSTEYTLKFQRK